MSFNRILAITGRIISQFRRDHRTLGLIFIAPIVIMATFGYIFRAQEGDVVRVAVVNEDRAPDSQDSLASPLVESLKANTSRLQVTEMAKGDATRAVEEGEQDVAVVFGPTFTSDLRTNRRTSVEVIVEGSNPTQSSGALSTVGQALSASAPRLVLASLPPSALPGLLPVGPPLEIKTTRLYGPADLQPLDFFAPMFIAYIGFFLVFLLRPRGQWSALRLRLLHGWSLCLATC
jgi:ABC-2 type transport system permease protein